MRQRRKDSHALAWLVRKHITKTYFCKGLLIKKGGFFPPIPLKYAPISTDTFFHERWIPGVSEKFDGCGAFQYSFGF
jgi:hypothetical protein